MVVGVADMMNLYQNCKLLKELLGDSVLVPVWF